MRQALASASQKAAGLAVAANLQIRAATARTRPMIQVTFFGALSFIFSPFLQPVDAGRINEIILHKPHVYVKEKARLRME